MNAGAKHYEGMCSRLRQAGVDTMIAPIHAWHWLPVLGGRSVRPILERIDFAVDAAADPSVGSMPWPQYSLLDLLVDFKNTPGGVMRAGGTSDPDYFPTVEPRGGFYADAQQSRRPFGSAGPQQQRRKVALVAHSAAGWIRYVMLSQSVPYDVSTDLRVPYKSTQLYGRTFKSLVKRYRDLKF